VWRWTAEVPLGSSTLLNCQGEEGNDLGPREAPRQTQREEEPAKLSGRGLPTAKPGEEKQKGERREDLKKSTGIGIPQTWPSMGCRATTLEDHEHGKSNGKQKNVEGGSKKFADKLL